MKVGAACQTRRHHGTSLGRIGPGNDDVDGCPRPCRRCARLGTRCTPRPSPAQSRSRGRRGPGPPLRVPAIGTPPIWWGCARAPKRSSEKSRSDRSRDLRRARCRRGPAWQSSKGLWLAALDPLALALGHRDQSALRSVDRELAAVDSDPAPVKQLGGDRRLCRRRRSSRAQDRPR